MATCISPETCNGMTSYLTDEEKEVAEILCTLPTLLHEFSNDRQCGIAANLKWGRRRPRSVSDERAPPARKEDAEEEEEVEEKKRLASPMTPLAFPVSGGEEEGVKKPKRHRQWVKEQTGMIATLSQQNADLRRQIEEQKARLESSRGINKSFKEMKSKMKQPMQQPQLLTQSLQLQQPEVTHPIPLPATTTNTGIGTSFKCQWASLPSASSRPAFDLDLNKPPEEAAAAEEIMSAPASWCGWAQQNVIAYKFVATEARKRRREIRRAKNRALPVYIAGMPAALYNVQRVRS